MLLEFFTERRKEVKKDFPRSTFSTSLFFFESGKKPSRPPPPAFTSTRPENAEETRAKKMPESSSRLFRLLQFYS